jgi:hypothetical protein
MIYSITAGASLTAFFLLFGWLGVGPSAPVVKRVADPANLPGAYPGGNSLVGV